MRIGNQLVIGREEGEEKGNWDKWRGVRTYIDIHVCGRLRMSAFSSSMLKTSRIMIVCQTYRYQHKLIRGVGE